MTYEQMQTELEELERHGWDSLCEGTAADFYGSIMTDDGVMVLANGMTMDHHDVVEALRAAPTWEGMRSPTSGWWPSSRTPPRSSTRAPHTGETATPWSR